MKKTFAHILAFFMATLVFYGGAGINIITYCCIECRSAGIEALLNDKCCDIHHHDHAKSHNHELTASASCCNHIAHINDNCEKPNHPTHTESSCCDSGRHDLYNSDCNNSTGDSCNIERIDFDWSFQNLAELKIDLSPNAYNLFSNIFLNNSPAHLPYICENITAMPNAPPLVLPRDYLSVLTVLLI